MQMALHFCRDLLFDQRAEEWQLVLRKADAPSRKLAEQVVNVNTQAFRRDRFPEGNARMPSCSLNHSCSSNGGLCVMHSLNGIRLDALCSISICAFISHSVSFPSSYGSFP